jgi:hypothetical protein
VPRGATRLEVIPLKAIVGTVEPTVMFDARFRPTSELVRVGTVSCSESAEAA